MVKRAAAVPLTSPPRVLLKLSPDLCRNMEESQDLRSKEEMIYDRNIGAFSFICRRKFEATAPDSLIRYVSQPATQIFQNEKYT